MSQASQAEAVEILLVVDSNEQEEWLRASFAKMPLIHVAHVVKTGDAALAYLRQTHQHRRIRPPGLVLIDMQLEAGGKHALEVLSELKGDRVLRSLPVILLTDAVRQTDVLNAYSSGACSFVTKPESTEARDELIRRFSEYWSLVAVLPQTVYAERAGGCATAAPETPDQTTDLGQPGSTCVRTLEILLVEDNDDDVILMQEAFADSRLVHVIRRVEDGDEALAYLRREPPFRDAQPPGLVLLDINMPKKNGFEVLVEIKDSPELRIIPIVMLTSSRQEVDVVQAYRDGACSFITKPVSFDRMKEVAAQFAMYWSLVAEVP